MTNTASTPTDMQVLNSLKSVIDPELMVNIVDLGMIYYTYYNQPEKAIVYLKKAILLDTNYVEAYFNLATCEAKLKNYATAERYYLKTIEIDPNFVGTYFSISAINFSAYRLSVA